jgi:hypothetical protein
MSDKPLCKYGCGCKVGHMVVGHPDPLDHCGMCCPEACAEREACAESRRVAAPAKPRRVATPAKPRRSEG